MAMQPLSRQGSVIRSVKWETTSGWAGARQASHCSARLYRKLPLVLLATASIVVLPSLLASALVPARGIASALAAAAVAMAISFALASAEAAAWKRWRRAGDLMFADLMLWSWVRRLWIERRLRSVRSSYEAARRAGTPVRVELLEGLSRLLEARSAYTHGHCRRVARHAEAIARAMGLAPRDVARIRTAAAVHDLGKVYTPSEILQKTGPLTEEEYAVVKRHAADGADMLASVGDARLAAIVRHHHERLDGSGYPDRLVGGEIPLGARIVAVADTFDAITSDRPYRSSYSHRVALEILSREAGAQLDGEVVAVFLDRYAARRSVASLAFASALLTRVLAALRPMAGGLAGGGVSIAGLGPALGAAGLLAAAVPHHGVSGEHKPMARLGSLSRAAPASAHSGRRTATHGHTLHGKHSPGGPQSGARLHTAAPPVHPSPTLHVRSHRPGVAPPASTPSNASPGGASGGSTTASSPSASPHASESPHGSGGPVQEAVEKAGEATSSVSAPTPSVTVPSATTPSVTTPGVTAPSVTTPSVTVSGKG